MKSPWNPLSWFSSTKDKAVAQAHKKLTGYDLERRLLNIDLEHGDISNIEYTDALETLDLKYLSKQANDKTHFEELKLQRALTRGDIKHHDYEREIATLQGEPYVTVLNMGVDSENVVQGYIELDWNDHFVKMLSEAGITGTSDEDIVNKWFNGVCRTVLWQEKADLDYGLNNDRGRPDVEYRSESKD